MSERTVILDITRWEAAHLVALVDQFVDLLADSEVQTDPALGRLVPDAYSDAEAAAEFRRLTQDDLLSRRADDAGVVVSTLLVDGERPQLASLDDLTGRESFVVALDPVQTAAWLRTLAALRLVLATRLGIAEDDDHDDGDPRFGVYDWLGYRLDGLVQALER